MDQTTEPKKKNANVELLRIITMIMVTMLHALGKSDLLLPMNDIDSVNGWLAWGLEILSICAVNVFMLISGYFMINSRFKLGRLFEIILETMFYSLAPLLVFLAFGKVTSEDLSIYSLLQYFAPIHMDTYWFITAYVVTYLLSPFLSAGIHSMEKKQLRTVILCLLAYECFIISISPVKYVVDDEGYTFLWYCIVFLIGAYFRKYGFRFLDKSYKGSLVYFAACVLIYAETAVLYWFKERTGRLEDFTSATLHYNQFLVLMAAIGLFVAFLHAKPLGGKVAKLICAISPLVLGVYLLQENLKLRFEWQGWFGLKGSLSESMPLFLLRLLGAVIGMFLLGIAVDALRSILFRAVQRIFSKAKDTAK